MQQEINKSVQVNASILLIGYQQCETGFAHLRNHLNGQGFSLEQFNYI